MEDMTKHVAAAAVAAYDFSRFRCSVDAGGGNGALLASLLATTPGLNGILFDLPSGTEGAPELIAAAGISERCKIIHGDFFKAVPAGADVYILKSVMHNWNDEMCCAILKNCAAVMSESTRLLLLEQVLPARIEAVPLHRRVLMTDLNMLVMTGGCDPGEAHINQILRESGLEIRAIVPTASSFSIIEANRAPCPQ